VRGHGLVVGPQSEIRVLPSMDFRPPSLARSGDDEASNWLYRDPMRTRTLPVKADVVAAVLLFVLAELQALQWR
jgi:hypothetical protein